jgi:hypothetical protein
VSVLEVALTGTASSSPITQAAAATHIRRCVHRRLSAVRCGSRLAYDVDCLQAGHLVPLPLGDLDTARPICNSCEAPHVFRPDAE